MVLIIGLGLLAMPFVFLAVEMAGLVAEGLRWRM